MLFCPNALLSCSSVVCTHEETLSPSFVAFHCYSLWISSLSPSLACLFVVGPHSIVTVCVCRRPSQHGMQSRQTHANRWYWFFLCATDRYCRSLLSYDHDSFLLSVHVCGVTSFAFELSLFFIVCFIPVCSRSLPPPLSFVCFFFLIFDSWSMEKSDRETAVHVFFWSFGGTPW